MARLYVESYVRLQIVSSDQTRLLIFWIRWYTEDCMRIPACKVLKVVGKHLAAAFVSCWIALLFFLVSFSFELDKAITGT